MRQAWRRLFSAGVLVVLVFVVGCASPRANSPGRKGIFDILPGRSTDVPTPVGDREFRRLKQVTRNWQWPLEEVVVTSKFGRRGRRFHDGVDLRAATGTPVFAAHSGKVVYSGSKITGYGNLVLIQDPKTSLVTIYAHNSKLMVKEGQTVKQGQRIAISGRSGHVTGPHVHFEVRRGVTPLDPLAMISSEKVARTDFSGRSPAVGPLDDEEE